MKPLLRSCVVALLMVQVYGLGVEAAVFERDWKAPGDGLLTYDNVNQREWLDLSASLLNQFPEPWLENAVSEIGPGGLFEGFHWARRDDVIALAQSGGINTSTGDYATNQVATGQLMNLLDVTLVTGGITRSLGFIDPNGLQVPTPPRAGAEFSIRVIQSTGMGVSAGLEISSSSDFFTPPDNPNGVGLMLFQAVPEPSALSLALVGMVSVSPWTCGRATRVNRLTLAPRNGRA